MSETFPHHFCLGINLNDVSATWNLSVSGGFSSPDFSALCYPGTKKWHRSIRDIPIDSLRGLDQCPGGMVSPGSAHVWYAHDARTSGKILLGPERREMPKNQMEKTVRKADLEIEFERMRRKNAPEAPSRLSCIYLAEDNENGRELLRRMLGDGPSYHLYPLQVRVPLAVRFARVDSAWVNMFYRDPNPDFIRKYWRGEVAENETPAWEFLIDGLVRVTDLRQLDVIREHCGYSHQDPTSDIFDQIQLRCSLTTIMKLQKGS